jgi:hypothetical protein
MDAIRPFLLDVNTTPDHNLSDTEQEIQTVLHHERLLTEFLRGKVGLDVVDDHLAQQGINPHEYWDCVHGVIDRVVEGQLTIDTGVELFISALGSDHLAPR